MKRMLAAVAAVAAGLSIVAATASAGTTLTASITAFFDVGGTPATIPFSLTYGDGTQWSCTGNHIIISATESKDVETCTITGDTAGFELGTYTIPDELDWVSDYFWSVDESEVYATSGTMTLSIAAAPAAPATENGVFLCYSAYQDQPGVWPANEAKALLEKGYWYPYAVSGKVAGGTNVGDYHLTCNIASTQSVSKTSFVGGDGTVLGSAYAGVLGVYPMIGG